jgi:hypothetical protein
MAVIAEPVNDAAVEQQELQRMRDYFAGQPKVSIKCREDERVQINGYVFIIKGGERVDVPKDVADILEESGRI